MPRMEMTDRIAALEAERDALRARAERAEAVLRKAERHMDTMGSIALAIKSDSDRLHEALGRMSWRQEARAALAAAAGKGE